MVSRENERGVTPKFEYRKWVGRNPQMPLTDDGILTEPPVSVPNPAGTK